MDRYTEILSECLITKSTFVSVGYPFDFIILINVTSGRHLLLKVRGCKKAKIIVPARFFGKNVREHPIHSVEALRASVMIPLHIQLSERISRRLTFPLYHAAC